MNNVLGSRENIPVKRGVSGRLAGLAITDQAQNLDILSECEWWCSDRASQEMSARDATDSKFLIRA